MKVLVFHCLLIILHACMSRDKATSQDVNSVAPQSTEEPSLLETQQLDALLNELEAEDGTPQTSVEAERPTLDPAESMPCILCLLEGMSNDTFGGFSLPAYQSKYSPSQLAYGNFLKHVAQNALRWVANPDSKVRSEPYLTSGVTREMQPGESVIIQEIQGDFAKIGDKEYIEISNLQIRPLGKGPDDSPPDM